MRFVHVTFHLVDDLWILLGEVFGFTQIVFQIIKFDRMKAPALLFRFGNLHRLQVSLAKRARRIRLRSDADEFVVNVFVWCLLPLAKECRNDGNTIALRGDCLAN